jgi:hypothetical protein
MKTKHNPDCHRVFNRYDDSCPRCQELKSGAKPRAGWNDLKKHQDAQRIQAIHKHFAPGGPHSQGKCGPVCTAFDW